MDRSDTRACPTAAAILLLAPGASIACGHCVDLSIEFQFPFIRPWVAVFAFWWLARRTALGGFVTKTLKLIGLWFLSAILSLGGVYVGFLPLFVFCWWESIRVSIGPFFGSRRHPRWWLVANGLTFVATTILVAHSCETARNDPETLRKFLKYRGGPHRLAEQRAIEFGPRALDVVADTMLREPDIESVKKRGVAMLEKMTGRSFPGGVDEALAWWRARKNRPTGAS